MQDNIKTVLSGYVKYRSRGQFAFIMHRIAGLATLAFLTLHIATTSTVFFVPPWYDVLIQLFRNPIIMFVEIVLAFFVVYHGVNGLRIAIFDLLRNDLWVKSTTKKSICIVIMVAIILWLPALVIMGYNLFKFGLGFFAGV